MSGQHRFCEEGSALERVCGGQKTGTSLSRWFQHHLDVSCQAFPFGDFLGTHSWKVTLTDIEFIGGNIFRSPPPGKPVYPQGGAGQHHPFGKSMCSVASASWSQRGGGNQTWKYKRELPAVTCQTFKVLRTLITKITKHTGIGLSVPRWLAGWGLKSRTWKSDCVIYL